MAKANLNGAALFVGQLGKLGDETFPARILEYVGLRSKMYSILTVQPDGARKEKRKIKAEEGGDQRPAS